MSGPIVTSVSQIAGSDLEWLWHAWIADVSLRAAIRNNRPHRDSISMSLCTKQTSKLTRREYQLKTEW